jgi:Zn-dependent protease/predicted transcriptional regulator
MSMNPSGQSPRQPATGGMAGSFRLFRLFGLDVFVHWSWLVIFALLSWSLASEYLPSVYAEWTARQRWIIGALTSLLFFASVLAHELSHSIEARRRGMDVEGITLFIFGGVSSLGSEARRPRDEFWIAVVGPLTSLVAAAVFGGIWLAARATDARGVQAVAGYLAYINVAVGLFNLLPGFPLDGGRVFRSIVWGRRRNLLEATRISANAGRIVGGIIIAIGVLELLAGGLAGLWFIFIGWFLWNTAESSYQQMLLQRMFHGLIIGPLVEHDVPRVSPDVTLRQLAHEYILRQNRRVFFIAAADTGDVFGLITLRDLRKVPDEKWDEVSVYRAMTPRERLITVTPRTEALTALQLMAQHNVNQLPVYEGNEPIGLLTRAALIGAVQLRSEMSAIEETLTSGGQRPAGPAAPRPVDSA